MNLKNCRVPFKTSGLLEKSKLFPKNRKNKKLDKILYGFVIEVMLIIISDHFLTTISYAFNINAQPFIFPAAFLVAISISYFCRNRISLSLKEYSISLIVCLIALLTSFIVAAGFYDFSWDGLWYHQAGIHFLEEGWNPFYAPDFPFTNCEKNSVLHFAKGPWYLAANLFSTFGHFEAAKCINILVILTVYSMVFVTSREYNISSRKSHLISVLVVLNPVIVNELFSFLVDQLLISYLIIYVVAFIKWFKDKSITSISLAAFAAICLINTKFTGLIYFVIASFIILAFLLMNNRNHIKHAILGQAIAFIFGVFVFGFNPYVTNTVNWGHPFYPVINPSLKENAEEKAKNDMNELYETPENMVGKSTVYRFFYATFSKPGNAPFNHEKNAELMYPFMSQSSDWLVYRFHEARVSGFGPYFSGILILSLILSVIISLKHKRYLIVLFLISSGIIFSIFLNKHFWIPRFAPQLWYLPIVSLVLAWTQPLSKKLKNFTYLIGLIILVNSAIVTFIHISWEMKSTNKLEQQLTELKKSDRGIVVHCQWFKKSIEERLSNHGIKFEFVKMNEIENAANTELQTIVDGYPGKVLFSFQE